MHSAELDRIAEEYRRAFDEVQRLLGGIRLPYGIPPHVFGIDGMSVREVGALDKTLGRAEQRRRQWRAALHAMIELAALQTELPADPGRVMDTLDPDNPSNTFERLAVPPDGGMASLDRFISVVQWARTQGLMYVDGGFQPEFKGKGNGS